MVLSALWWGERDDNMALDKHVVNLCNLFQERAAELSLRGKRRDDEAIAFFVGAAHGFALSGDDATAANIAAFASFGMAFRGYREIERALRDAS